MINLEGMTVNERSYALDLMDDFDLSIRSGKREVAIKILEMAQFSISQAREKADNIFNDPKRYGY